MITPSGAVKVLDFGVAALLGPAEVSRLTATGHTLGTPAYIAPEQASAGPVGPGADLYALGCILFEMLAGKTPYEATNAPDMLRRHLHAPIPIVTEYRPDLPDDLAHLIYCLLGKTPTDRPGSAEHVQRLLAPMLGGECRTLGGKSGGAKAWAQTPVSSTPTPSTRQELTELHQRAQELAEQERFVQAADLLQLALQSAQAGHEALDPQVVTIRLDLANLRMLAGDYPLARTDFDNLARLLEQHGGDQSLARQCRKQARSCQLPR